MIEIKKLDETLVKNANYNSFNGTRGTNSEKSYNNYCNKILSWNISDNKKTELLNTVYKKWCEILRHESSHVSVMVAGPANYNSKKLDHSDKILKLSSDFYNWFKELEEQIKRSEKTEEKTTFKEFVSNVERIPYTVDYLLMDLIKEKNKDIFIQAFEYVEEKGIKKYRKNTNIYKLYDKLKNGGMKFKEKEIIFENNDFSAFIEDERVYIKFMLKPKRQLIVALKSRGYWWNSGKSAWSTYINKLDKDWIVNISERYSNYL